MDRMRSQRSAASSSGGRSLLHRTLRKPEGDIELPDIKGPLGLNTLHDPPLPAIADLVFVHGLGGGSRSTWTKNNDSSLYWPQEWLPKDSAFQDVRVHTFGYDANFEKESILNLHDFAKALVAALNDCPLMPKNLEVNELDSPRSAALFM